MGLKNQPPTNIHGCLQVVECDRQWRDFSPTSDINVRTCKECGKDVHNIMLKDLLRWKPQEHSCIFIDFAGLAKVYPHILERQFPYAPAQIIGIVKAN